MKPQKRSIKDFFSPVSRSPQDSPRATPQPQLQLHRGRLSSHVLHDNHRSSDAGNARASPLGSASLTANTAPSTPASADTSSAPHAPAKATSPDAPPPSASQASANSGASKRIVSNGEQVVLNSDSDTDSLPDIDWGLPTTTPKTKTKTKTATPATRSKRVPESENDGLRKPEKKLKSRNQAFDHVFETAQRHRELERAIVEHKADLEKDDDVAPEFVFNEDALGQAVQDTDDPDQAHRLFLAMQRTNAVQEEHVFHLFRDTSDSIAVRSRFPANSLPNHGWASNFRDATARDQAFMTGFAHQVFRLQELPEEMASWMIDHICLVQSEALDSRYLEILEAHNQYLHKLINRNRLDAILKTLGGDVKRLNSDNQISPEDSPSRAPSLPPSLKSVARLLERAAPWLRTKARAHAFYVLCHVCMDDRVIANPDVLGQVQNAIEATICNFADNQKLVQGLSDVLPRLLSRVTHPILQRNLVSALPSTSPLTAYLRRHLALAFILHPMAVDLPLADRQLPAIIHTHLETSSNYRINKTTDYGFLAARMTLLDIAIGPGPLTVPYQPLVNQESTQTDSSPMLAPNPSASEVKEFNKAVDALTLHIKMLGNSIVEAGAVIDLTILEAKDCVERLCSRLEHAVRIGGKKSHNVFGNEEEEKQLKVTDIFRKAAAKAKKAAPTGGIFDDDDGVDMDEEVDAQIQAEVAS